MPNDPLVEVRLRIDRDEERGQQDPRIRGKRPRREGEDVERKGEQFKKKTDEGKGSLGSKPRAGNEMKDARKAHQRAMRQLRERERLLNAVSGERTSPVEGVARAGQAGLGRAVRAARTIAPGLSKKMGKSRAGRAAMTAGRAGAAALTRVAVPLAIARAGLGVANRASETISPGAGEQGGTAPEDLIRGAMNRVDEIETWVMGQIKGLQESIGEVRQDMLLVGGDPSITPFRAEIASVAQGEARYERFIDRRKKAMRDNRALEQVREWMGADIGEGSPHGARQLLQLSGGQNP